MSKFIKTIRYVFVLLVTIFTVYTYLTITGVIAFGPDLGNIQDAFTDFAGTDYGFYIISIAAGLIILGALIMFISTLARQTSRSSLTLVDQDGKVELTDDAIEAYAYRSLKNFPQLKDPDVTCKILDGSSKKVVIKVRTGIHGAANLSELSVQIKDKLKNDIDLFIGKPVADVNVVLDRNIDRNIENTISNGTHSMSIE
ncbi:MAG: alkaline shock response membrane anchor protein AmaP [Anaerovoracaceae bacterium]|nr:alkaline shock response membrane anchor protein AmaP [Anaerovoracaceae bacterium]